MNKLTNSKYVNRVAKLVTGMTLALGLVATSQGQTIVTNYVNFSDHPGDNSGPIANSTVANLPNGITLSWGFQFFWRTDFTSPAGSTESFDCSQGPSLKFSQPVVLWSFNTIQWGSNRKISGRLGGSTVWKWDGTGTGGGWVTVTNGAGWPIDEIVFDTDAWSSRYTDFYLSDATGITPPNVPLITDFSVTPDTSLRNPGASVDLVYQVDPTCDDVEVDNGVGSLWGFFDGGGNGTWSINPSVDTTYTITVTKGTNIAIAKVTVKAPALPANVGFVTFEKISTWPVGDYNWNMPAGVFAYWENWYSDNGSVGSPTTAKLVWPKNWDGLAASNSLDMPIEAKVTFTDAEQNPTPVVINSFCMQDNPPGTNWGVVVIEGSLGGVSKWIWNAPPGGSWETYVTAGAGIPIDMMTVTGYFYHYDNFSISTPDAKVSNMGQLTPFVQNGQAAVSWTSVADWASYLVMETSSLTNQWWKAGFQAATPAGSTNTYSEGTNSAAFYRVLRVP